MVVAEQAEQASVLGAGIAACLGAGIIAARLGAAIAARLGKYYSITTTCYRMCRILQTVAICHAGDTLARSIL